MLVSHFLFKLLIYWKTADMIVFYSDNMITVADKKQKVFKKQN